MALTAQGRRLGQIEGVLKACIGRRENSAHWAGIDQAISVAANLLINRAVVHAGATSNASEHLFKLTAQKTRAAAINEHEIQMVWAIGLALCTDTGEQLHVVGNGLPRCRS